MRRLLALGGTIAAAVLLTLSFTVPAHAEQFGDGICESGGPSDCWRSSYSTAATNLWARDVSGDVEQQFGETYAGTVANDGSGKDCLAGLSSTLQNEFATTGVYIFQDVNNYFIEAGNGGYLYEDQSFNGGQYDYFMWTSGGQLVNCGQSQYWKALDFVCHVTLYTQLYVNGNCGGTTWQTIHV